MSKFLRNDSPVAAEWVSEKFKLLKYEHITYHFKARDLEIPLIYFFARYLNFAKIQAKQISRNFLTQKNLRGGQNDPPSGFSGITRERTKIFQRKFSNS